MANLPNWAIGLIAGLSSALLYAAASGGAGLALVLAYVAPLPIFVAGLGWGTAAATVGGVTGLVVIAAAAGISNAVVYFSVAALGPIWLTRLALLSRPVGGRGPAAEARAARAREAHHRAVAEGTRDGPPPPPESAALQWYPAGRLIVWATLIAAALLTLTIISLSAAEGGIRGAVAQMINTGIVDTGELSRLLDAQGLDVSAQDFLRTVATLVPAMAASMWLVMTMLNMMLAQLVVERSGQALRPTPDPASIDYPRAFHLVLPVAVILSFVPGESGYAAASVAAVLFVPYFLLGLAVIHAISRGWRARAPMLAAVYVCIILFGWVIIPVGMLGIVEAWAGLRARHVTPGDDTPGDDTPSGGNRA